MSQMHDENMAKVRESMRVAQQVRQGGNLSEGELIDFTSSEDRHYYGYVVFKKPSLMDVMTMGGKKAEYLKRAGVTDVALVDDSILFMAQVMGTLEVVCIKRPDWLLTIESIEETEVLFHVYGKYVIWENSFRKKIRPTPTDDSAPAGGEKALDASEVRVRRDSTD